MNKLWLQYDRKVLQELDKFKDKGTVFAFASLSQGHVHCVVLNTEKNRFTLHWKFKNVHITGLNGILTVFYHRKGTLIF